MDEARWSLEECLLRIARPGLDRRIFDRDAEIQAAVSAVHEPGPEGCRVFVRLDGDKLLRVILRAVIDHLIEGRHLPAPTLEQVEASVRGDDVRRLFDEVRDTLDHVDEREILGRLLEGLDLGGEDEAGVG